MPEPLLSVARDMAYRAGRRVMDVLRSGAEISRKPDRSPVTSADHESNDIIRAEVRRLFPNHGLLSEETGREGPSTADHVWVIDPLDGTRAFMKGLSGFSVMIGILREGRPHAGVVYDPRAQTLFEAERGEGAWLLSSGRRVRLRVSNRNDWWTMPAIVSPGFPEDLRRSLELKAGIPFLDPLHGVGVKVGYLLRRLADVYINHHPVHVWDTCAPLVILEEAGGRLTHEDGSSLSFDVDKGIVHDQPTVASNGARHDDLLALVASLKGRS